MHFSGVSQAFPGLAPARGLRRCRAGPLVQCSRVPWAAGGCAVCAPRWPFLASRPVCRVCRGRFPRIAAVSSVPLGAAPPVFLRASLGLLASGWGFFSSFTLRAEFAEFAERVAVHRARRRPGRRRALARALFREVTFGATLGGGGELGQASTAASWATRAGCSSNRRGRRAARGPRAGPGPFCSGSPGRDPSSQVGPSWVAQVRFQVGAQ